MMTTTGEPAADALSPEAAAAAVPEIPRMADSGMVVLVQQQAYDAKGGSAGDQSPASGGSRPGTPSGRWRAAARKVQMGLALSARLSTLRDRYGVNEIDLSELKTVKKLGEGAFATVEQCLYSPSAGGEPAPVAVKKLKPEVVAHPEDQVNFISEVALMRKLKHKHIVEYIGIGSTDKSSEAQQRSTLFLVSELMDGGTLKKLVMRQMTHMHRALYSDDDALRWCIQIADALAYLHESKPQVIHRDLKLENILLKTVEKGVLDAKLSDFGLVAFVRKAQANASASAKAQTPDAPPKPPAAPPPPVAPMQQWTEKTQVFLQRLSAMPQPPSTHAHAHAPPYNKTLASVQASEPSVTATASLPTRIKEQLSGRTGTLMYMAPEMFKEQQYTEKVDVFSFAVICYELCHKYMMVFAVSNAGTEEEIEHYAEKVAGGWRPPLSDKFSPELLGIIQDAWAQDPKDRPSMKEIRDRLISVQRSREQARLAKQASRQSSRQPSRLRQDSKKGLQAHEEGEPQAAGSACGCVIF